MKKIFYKTQGTCSQFIELEADDEGRVSYANVIGGCNGNLQGICKLIKGMPLEEVHAKLKGIRCGTKMTSCPDQIALAIEEMERKDLTAHLKAGETTV